jgi:hypothetical protein
MKARQRVSIQRIGEALTVSGMNALDEKARALGLSRSTAWTVLKGGHKATGLTADVVMRILAAPCLPNQARTQVARYIEEKAAGSFGHTIKQRRRFASQFVPWLRSLR